MMNSSRGMITVDFLFAMVLVLGFTSILFALSMTLTVAEVTQYITFASARNYFAGHLSHERQKELALAKYYQLLENGQFAPLFRNGWFQVDQEPAIGDISRVIPSYRDAAGGGNFDSKNMFWGVGTNFTAIILDFQIPIYGSTNPQGDGSGSGFRTFLGSYLGREISTQECQQFMRARWANIRNLEVQGAAPYTTFTTNSGYSANEDNGC